MNSVSPSDLGECNLILERGLCLRNFPIRPVTLLLYGKKQQRYECYHWNFWDGDLNDVVLFSKTFLTCPNSTVSYWIGKKELLDELTYLVVNLFEQADGGVGLDIC